MAIEIRNEKTHVPTAPEQITNGLTVAPLTSIEWRYNPDTNNYVEITKPKEAGNRIEYRSGAMFGNMGRR